MIYILENVNLMYKLHIMMNRTIHYDYILEKLTNLSTQIDIRGSLNILDLHIHAETFYMYFFNKIFNLELKNMNNVNKNYEAIDLVDEKNKIVVQVSATATKYKIESALSKPIMNSYKGYKFYFISISKDASKLKNKNYKNHFEIIFNPQEHIFDNSKILNIVLNMDIDRQRDVYEFIKKELGQQYDMPKLKSNLAHIINILAEEELSNQSEININEFEIDLKIAFNSLKKVKYIIDDYKAYIGILQKIYSNFDNFGKNKSLSVLDTIRNEYILNLDISNHDDMFIKIIDNIKNKIVESPNFNKIPIEELDLCVNILIVDSFIKCKIFENPKDYNYVTSGQY